MKLPIILIHGGMTFKSTKDHTKYLKTKSISLDSSEIWSGSYLDKKLRTKIIRPRMPLADNAHYKDWEIVFSRYLDVVGNCFVIGHFLGGVFLAQYLSKHKDKRVKGVYLVAPPFDNATIDTEDLVNGFSIKKIDLPYPFVRVYFATDDSIVSPQHADKYTKFVEDVYLLDNRGHFITKTFPELIKHIKQDYKKYRKSVRT